MKMKIRLLALILVILAQVGTASTTFDFGSSPVGPITNNLGSGGDFAGTEYHSLGALFSVTGNNALNIGCGTAVGDPSNCLGANAGGLAADDFSGTLLITFDLGGTAQVVDSVSVFYCCAGNTGQTHTVIRDFNGNILVDVTGQGTVSLTQAGIYSIQSTFGDDAIDTLTFGNLSAAGTVPEPSTVGLVGVALGGLFLMRRRRTSQAFDAQTPRVPQPNG
jgi:hypothetical protein